MAKPDDVVCLITAEARALLCVANEIPELANPGRGVTVIKTAPTDGVIGFAVGRPREKEVLIAETDAGKKISVGPGRYQVTGRGGRGHALARKAKIVAVTRATPPETSPVPTLLN
jgi:DNA gyrase subunit A